MRNIFGRTRARACALALLVIAALSDCTCAGAERNHAYHAYLRGELDAYAHAGAREDVAADARALLLDRGFTLPPWDGRARTTTGWKDLGDDVRERLHVDASAHAGGTAVRFTLQTQTREPPHWTRDSRRPDLELSHALFARIHPERAAAMKLDDAADVIYDVASAILWNEIRSLLGERGEGFATWEPPVDVTAASEWIVHDGDEPSRVRHDVRLVALGSGRHRVEIHRVIERATGPRGWLTSAEARDWDAELDLLRRRDPTAAGTIEAEAQQRGQIAYEDAIDHGAMACSVRGRARSADDDATAPR